MAPKCVRNPAQNDLRIEQKSTLIKDQFWAPFWAAPWKNGLPKRAGGGRGAHVWGAGNIAICSKKLGFRVEGVQILLFWILGGR